MLRVVQCFGKHCSCHLQGEFLAAEKWAHSSAPPVSPITSNALSTPALHKVARKKQPIFTLKMAAALFAKTLENSTFDMPYI
jgi:hypothetical protein